MATTATPYGLKPVKRLDGLPYSGAFTQYLIDPAGEASNLYYGQVVILGADGYVALATASGADATTNNLGGSSIGALGVFVGCSYQNALGTQYSQYYPTGQNYNSTPIYAHVVEDPNVLFQMQAAGALTQTDIGLNSTFNAVQGTSTGSTSTGNSTSSLSTSTATTAKAFRLHSFVSPTTDAYPDVLVYFNSGFHRATNNVGL